MLPREQVTWALVSWHLGVQRTELEPIEVAILVDRRVTLVATSLLELGLDGGHRFTELIVLEDLDLIGMFPEDRCPVEAELLVVGEDEVAHALFGREFPDKLTACLTVLGADDFEVCVVWVVGVEPFTGDYEGVRW